MRHGESETGADAAAARAMKWIEDALASVDDDVTTIVADFDNDEIALAFDVHKHAIDRRVVGSEVRARKQQHR